MSEHKGTSSTENTVDAQSASPDILADLTPERLSETADLLERALSAEAGSGIIETFISDIHGAAPAFDHLIRSASGQTRLFVERACAEAALSEDELAALCVALYWPERPEVGELAAAAGVDIADLAVRVRTYDTGAFHMLGDVWDRGSQGDEVADLLMAVPDVDVQWGNHDVCWMGAAAGDPVSIANCLRNNIRYGNDALFEEGYGIDLAPLYAFAQETYRDNDMISPVIKAISAILFKCEGQAIMRHPEWHMEDRLLWDKIDPAAGTVLVYGVEQPLMTHDFPTWNAEDPYALTDGETALVDQLVAAFRNSERLQRQVSWLYDHGNVYRIDGDLLLLHGCVPLDEDGSLAIVDCGEGSHAGRDLLDWTDVLCRRAWEQRDVWALDWMGYLWAGWQSTFAGRVVKTFERTYIEDQTTWKEPEDPYYALTRTDPAPCEMILAAFGIDPKRGRIINGHTPVKLPKGESPIRGAGRRLVIDGGLCERYRKSTGIAGYTLLRDADGLHLITHGEFPGKQAVFEFGADIEHTEEDID